MKKLLSLLVFFLLVPTLVDAQIRFRQEQQHASTAYTNALGAATGVSLSLTAATNQIVLDSDAAVNTGTITMASLTAARIWTFPNSGGTVALQTDTLGAFATTTSLGLIGVISDETGTDKLVFNTSPTLVTPILGTPTSGVLTNLTGLPLTTGVTGILPTANGGTGIAYFTAAGPSVARVYTFPDAAATIARTDAGQTFTGVQTMTSPAITTPVFTNSITGTYTIAGTPTLGANLAGGGFSVGTLASPTGRLFASMLNIGTAADVGTLLNLSSSSSDIVGFTQSGATSGAIKLLWQKSRGTLATPLAITTGDTIGLFSFNSHDGTAFDQTAAIGVVSTGTVATGRRASIITFSTSPDSVTNGVITERLRITETGRLGIGITANINQTLTFDNAGTIGFVNAAANTSYQAVTMDSSDDIIYGNTTTPQRIRSSGGTPGNLGNGDWWAECSGTTPNRICSMNVYDGSATRILSQIVY